MEHHQTLTIGTQLEHYHLDKVLGAGGCGVTYRATDTSLNCPVAIKEYFPIALAERGDDRRTLKMRSPEDAQRYADGMERFLEEARLLAQVKLATIIGVNRSFKANNTAYFIMDFEEGLPLSRYLQSCKRLSEDEIINISLPILSGLLEVHEQGMLHHDIHPAHIQLRKAGLPVLLDFGAVRQALSDQTTADNMQHGYLPVEQCEAREQQGPWSDIYAFGATLYHAVTGRSPINATERLSEMENTMRDPLIPAIKAGQKAYHSDLLKTIDWMLEPHVKDRPQSIIEVIDALGYLEPADKKHKTGTDKEKVGTKSRWDIKEMAQLEEALASHIGPIARLMMHRAMRMVKNKNDLVTYLADNIELDKIREDFLKQAQSILSQPKEPEVEETLWDDATLRYAEEELAKHLGPMAGSLVQKAADQSMGIDEFIEFLLTDIPEENQFDDLRDNLANRKRRRA